MWGMRRFAAELSVYPMAGLCQTKRMTTMRTAIFADLHDNEEALQRVLEDAAHQGADKLIFLGDAGRNPQILDLLRERAVACTFGNWEVGQLDQLPPTQREWVAAWPATLRNGNALYCHATPHQPPAIHTAADVAALRAAGGDWLRLFPWLDRHEQAVWDALAVMEEERLRVVFHGHTHVQAGWIWQTDGAGRRQLRSFHGVDEIKLAPGPAAGPTRYLIGVGSAGQPEDGTALCYAIYDAPAELVWLRRLGRNE